MLVFDLGGVLLELNDPLETFGIGTGSDDFWKRWIHSSAVRDMERGAIDAATFAERLISEADLPYDSAELLARFDAWPKRLYPGIPSLLSDLSAGFGIGLLSNTNVRHWQRDGIADELERCCHELFLSFRTGLLKPDAPAYLQVIERFATSPSSIAFFDDNPVNVAAAQSVGMRAYLTRGAGPLRAPHHRSRTDQTSTTAASGALRPTESIPLSRPDSES